MERERGFSLDRERSAWWAVAAVLAAALVYVVGSFLGTFLLGLFVYYATRPIYHRLEHRIGQQTVTAVVSLFGLAFPGLLLLGYTVVVSVRELSSLAGVGLTQFEGVLGPYVDTSILVDPEQLVELVRTNPRQILEGGGTDAARELLSSVIAVLGVAASAALGLVIVLVVAFYLLRDDDRLAEWFRSEVADDASPTVAFGRAVDADLETVYFGNILTAFVIGVIGAVVFNLLALVAPPVLSVPSPTLLGLLTGLASLVPVVGMKLVYVPLGIVLAIVAGVTNPALLWFPALFLLVAFVVVDTIPEVVLRPYVSGRDLHTGLVMLAYILGPVLFGWYGLFLGPLLLVLVVHFVRIILPELLSPERVVSSGHGPTAMTDGSAAETNRPPADVGPPFAPIADRSVVGGAVREDEEVGGSTVDESDDEDSGGD